MKFSLKIGLLTLSLSLFFFLQGYSKMKMKIKDNRGVLEDFKRKSERKTRKRKEKKKGEKKQKKKKKMFSLPSKTMGCFSGCLMSTASYQKLFCKLCSPFNCSFDEFVGEKVVSPSYSSAILTPPLCLLLFISFLFTVIYRASSNNHFAFFVFLFLGNTLDHCLL